LHSDIIPAAASSLANYIVPIVSPLSGAEHITQTVLAQ